VHLFHAMSMSHVALTPRRTPPQSSTPSSPPILSPRQLFAPLSLLLALLLMLTTSSAAYGPLTFGLTLFGIGSTYGGLELMSSGSAAGCIVDAIGGDGPGAIPAIVAAVNALGSLSSLCCVAFVTSLLEWFGWDGVFRLGALMAAASGLVMLPLASHLSHSASHLSHSASSGVAEGSLPLSPRRSPKDRLSSSFASSTRSWAKPTSAKDSPFGKPAMLSAEDSRALGRRVLEEALGGARLSKLFGQPTSAKSKVD